MQKRIMGCCRVFLDTLIIAWAIVCDPFVRLFRCLFPKSKKSVKGEVILITGAGHGLGKELAVRFSDLGAVLVLWDINQESNEEVATKLRSMGRSVFAYRVDVTDQQEVVSAAYRVKQEIGDVSILINNAGVFSGQPICQLPTQLIRRCFEVNTLAHFWILQQFLPRMMELDHGHIVAIASIAGHVGVPNMTDYCASKYATVGLMESLNMELQSIKKLNIRLTTINPVTITTGLLPNVRTRFPTLMPLLSVDKTADIIVNSILREEEMVFIPKRIKCLNDLIACFRRKTRFKILDYLDYSFEPAVDVQLATKGTVEIV